jgi:putative nucleotidyltransferase with HDIG domain
MTLIRLWSNISWLASRQFLRLVLLVIFSLLSLAMLVFPIAIRPSSYSLEVGTVAQQDIQAPRTLTYKSEILTEQARVEAENSIEPVYSAADPTISRKQIENLRVSLTYITSVRADSYATPEQKAQDLGQLQLTTLSSQIISEILNLNDNRWESVQNEALSVLEQVMRNNIRESSLYEARRNIPSMISYSLPSDQASLVADLVSGFVVPNSLLSTDQTSTKREEARNAVQPVEQKFVVGETIIQRGEIITPLIWEALEAYNMIQTSSDSQSTLAASLLVVLTGAFIALYFMRRSPPEMEQLRSLTLIAFVFLIFLYGARLVIPNRMVVPYIYPIPAFGLTIASLFGSELGMVFSLLLCILSTYNVQNSLDLLAFYILSSFCGILMLGRGRRVASFFWAGVAIGAAGSAVVMAYRLPDSVTDWYGIATLLCAAFFNGMASASVSLLFQYLFSQLLGLTTAIQLLEISRPDHPLLQYLMLNAPGTYQHSLQVANLAEQAAEAIGADALLVRVGALYHDSGKSLNPSFFIENQIPGVPNPHDQLEPIVSSGVIIRHTTDGVALAKKYRLPPRIQDFILEHHGTMMTRYQYVRAVEAAGGNAELVATEQYRYPGPEPHSKETALLMLADGCEARARAELPKNDDELRTLVKRVIDYCQREGQLDYTALTLKDLNRVADSFVITLRNTHHPRLKYPEIKTIPTGTNGSPTSGTSDKDIPQSSLNSV